MKNPRIMPHCLLGLVFCLAAAVGFGRTAVFVQGVSDGQGDNAAYQTADCQLFGQSVSDSVPSSTENGNWGRAPLLMLGRHFALYNRILYRFDLSSLAGQYREISSARLVLKASYFFGAGEYVSFPTPVKLELYRLTPANAGWVEGTSTSGGLVEGAATWAWRAWRAATSLTWAGQRGCGSEGVDYVSPSSGTVSLSSLATISDEQMTFEFRDPAFLKDWITRPEINAGFLLRSSDLEAARPDVDSSVLFFHSDDGDSPADRPRLEIVYDPLPIQTAASLVWLLVE